MLTRLKDTGIPAAFSRRSPDTLLLDGRQEASLQQEEDLYQTCLQEVQAYMDDAFVINRNRKILEDRTKSETDKMTRDGSQAMIRRHGPLVTFLNELQWKIKNQGPQLLLTNAVAKQLQEKGILVLSKEDSIAHAAYDLFGKISAEALSSKPEGLLIVTYRLKPGNEPPPAEESVAARAGENSRSTFELINLNEVIERVQSQGIGHPALPHFALEKV